MEEQDKMINLIHEKKYTDAAEIFRKTPILNYQTENEIFNLDVFEYSKTKKKNPVFLRVLLNYISLINILLDQEISMSEFHQGLLYFCAKFSYEIQNGYIKLVLMAKTQIEIYNAVFCQGCDKIFENIKAEIKNSIDFSFDKKGNESIGFTFQELGRVFINDYIVGRDKGEELPNILFYIKSIEKMNKLIGKMFVVPEKYKLDLNEKISDFSGINEFDNIILLSQDFVINENNPYFRYIKTLNGGIAEYSNLEFKKNVIYILEFKHSYKMNEEIAKIEQIALKYLELYNKDISNIENSSKYSDYQILYFYNYLENIGYKNLTGYNINSNIWKFLYLSPSSQIAQVSNLSLKVKQLDQKVNVLEQTVKEMKDDNKLLQNKIDKIEKMISQNQPKIIMKKDDFSLTRNIKYKIDEEFQDISKTIKNVKEMNSYNTLFDKYKNEINNFINPEEKLEDDKNSRWEKDLFDGEISDDKTCFQLIAPCIGYKKASKNYKKIQTYFFSKINKDNNMSEIYKYLYKCFYGTRKLEDKSSFETFFKGESGIRELLVNIVKYTFYCERNGSEKSYYLLAVLKELIEKGDDIIKNYVFKLREKTLYQVVLMSIALINYDNRFNLKGYEECPIKNYI